MTVCFLSCLLKPFRLSLKLPRFPCYCDTLKRSPAALNDITTVPRICILCSARKSSCCSNWAGSFPSMAILCSSVEWLTASSPTCRGDTATAACQPVAVQGASFRGWKEVTSMFNKDDEQQLLAGCKSPKSKGTNLKLKEEMKSEKKPGFWDSLVIKQNVPSRKPDEIEGWEPPQITTADSTSDAATPLSDYTAWSGWEDETKGSTKYTNLASSGNSSRWSIKSAGKLVSIRRQSKGNLTDNWEELE
uniref:Testis development related protein n=35 Tax=Passeriformes TaxID=9126 RepID=A0A8D2NU31_ZOSLA